MPTVQKIAPEIAQGWKKRAKSGVSHLPEHYAWKWHPATLYITRRTRPLAEIPRIGDVLLLRAAESAPPAETTGVVLDVRAGDDGEWSEVELALADATRWIAASEIAAHLGRVKGVSRIDQPNKRIRGKVHGGMHGWFVRVYRGTTPCLTATFSDASAGSRRAALKAALAFHAAYVGLDAGEGVAFG